MKRIKNAEKNLNYLRYFSTFIDEGGPNKDTLYLLDDRYYVYDFFNDNMIEIEYVVGNGLRRSISERNIISSISKLISIVNLLLQIRLLINIYKKSKEG